MPQWDVDEMQVASKIGGSIICKYGHLQYHITSLNTDSGAYPKRILDNQLIRMFLCNYILWSYTIILTIYDGGDFSANTQGSAR